MTALKLIFGLLMLAPGPHVLRDIDGTLHGSLEKPGSWKWTLLYFLMSDCPIANQYAPEVQRICTAYGSKGVRCFLVYVDRTMKTPDIRKHMRDFSYTWPAILDSGHNLVDKAGATIVSEVAVFSSSGELKYRGRVDDRYAALGKPRQVVTQRDLANALDALIAGSNVTNSRTEAFGCFIPPK